MNAEEREGKKFDMSDKIIAVLPSIEACLPSRPRNPRQGPNPKPDKGQRFWEIDALRGLAVVMMVIYHFAYDLHFFQVTDMVFRNRFWFYFQRTIATTFIGLVGVSLTISYNRAIQSGRQEGVLFRKFFRRGLRIFGWGMLITLVTWFVLGRRLAVTFGILHFIGLSIVLAYPFLTRYWLNLSLGLVLIGLGKVLQRQAFDWPWLVWLGFEPANHFYVDYFPVVPWFGVVLLGVFVGRTLYKGNRRAVVLPDLSNLWLVRFLQWWGQRSLTVYLIHQPILFAILIPLLLLLGIGNVKF